MRFGIMSTQLEMLIPPDILPQGIIAHISSISHSDLIRNIVDCGFKLIELGGDLAMMIPQLYDEANIDNLCALKNELDLDYTVHLPLWSVEPSSPLTPIREGSVRAIVNHIQAVKRLDPELYVLHATGALAAEFYRMNLPSAVKKYLLAAFQEAAIKSIEIILNETEVESRKIAIETIEFPFDLTLGIADELDLSICFDTGHVLAGFSGPIPLLDALTLSANRIAELHLHDAPSYEKHNRIGYGKDHQEIGKGDLDVVGLVNWIQSTDFSGPLIFELSTKEAVNSMTTIRKLEEALKPG